MKKPYFIFIAILAGFIFVKCENDSKQDALSASEQFNKIRTTPGGCNRSPETQKVGNYGEDTVVFSVVNDSLNIFTGIRYICCAPFTSDITCKNDSIIIIINDVCPDPANSCYCRCNCYYTWDFRLGDYETKVYKYKATLKGNSDAGNVVIQEGEFTFPK